MNPPSSQSHRVFSLSREIDYLSSVESSVKDIEDFDGTTYFQLSNQPNYTRLCVFKTDPGPGFLQLSCFEESTSLFYEVILKEDWLTCPIEPGSYINVIAEFDGNRKAVLDNAKGTLIVNPDVLLSGTSVGQSFSCMRKAVLSERVRGHQLSGAALYGQLIHEAFQLAVETNLRSIEEMQRCADSIIAQAIPSLYAVGEDEASARARLYPTLDAILHWSNDFTGSRYSTANGDDQPFHVTGLLGVEEPIWSLKYGLNGKIDMSLEIEYKGTKGQSTYMVVPLEVKTGRFYAASHVSNRAQVIVYCLLMADRYRLPLSSGFLYYISPGNSSNPAGDMYRVNPEVPLTQIEFRQILLGRNRVSAYLLQPSDAGSLPLPPVIKNRRDCSTCPLQQPCMIYHSFQDQGSGVSSGLQELFEPYANYSPADRDFFLKWVKFIEYENTVAQQNRRDLWLQSSVQRQKVGRCLARLKLIEEDQKACSYTFRSSDQQLNILNHELGIGSFILVSAEEGYYGLGRGTIWKTTTHTVQVRMQSLLKPPPIRYHSGRFVALEEQRSMSFHSLSCLTWRLDTDESQTVTRHIRSNLVSLFKPGAEKLRRLVVDLERPKFDLSGPPVALPGLNEDQTAALNRVLSANDYALILGMPGTGKTTAIAALVRELALRGKSILLTSFTHSAVDNILLKLREMQVHFLRVGRANLVHADLQEFVLENQPCSTVKEFEALADRTLVYAATCYAMEDGLFLRRAAEGRRFDFCIVDEASQLTLPVSLGPLFHANVFVLVGDQYQLPPLVLHPHSRNVIPDPEISLFRRLCTAHDSVVVKLRSQYRMNEEIMALSNQLVYLGRLRCGGADVAASRLRLGPVRPVVAPWLGPLLDSELSVLFMDTDTVPGPEERQGEAVMNRVEANVVVHVVRTLLDAGLLPTQIGVISPYRAQLKAIRTALVSSGSSVASTGVGPSLEHAPSRFEGVEIHTVDKYQGRDKDCIVISFVRSNAAGTVGDLLSDWHRINVALTRAKTKLVLVGSLSTLTKHPLLDAMFAEMRARDRSSQRKRFIHLPRSLAVS